MPMRVRTFEDFIAAIITVLLVIGVQFLILGFLTAGHMDPFSLRVSMFAFPLGFGLIIVGALVLVFFLKKTKKRRARF